MNNSDKGEKLLSKTTDLKYSTKQVNKMHYLSAQNVEFWYWYVPKNLTDSPAE
jgi:hypothetical protein